MKNLLPTLSFKVWTSIVLGVFLSVVAIDLLSSRLYGERLGQHWLETKTSKAELLSRQKVQPDVILVGDSRTQNHFNTKAISSKERVFFNHGVVGSTFEDAIYSALNGLEVAKEGIVLNFSLPDLGSRIVCQKRPTFEEIEFMKATIDEDCNWSRLDGIFQKSMIRNSKFIRKPLEYFSDEKKFHKYLAQFDVKASEFDRPVNYVRGDRRRLVMTFDNGDGLVVSRPTIASTDGQPPKMIEIKSVNPKKLALLVGLAERSVEAGKKMIVNFELLGVNATCDVPVLPELEALVDIMVTCKDPYPYRFWSDRVHLNREGVKRYNREFMDMFEKLWNKGEAEG